MKNYYFLKNKSIIILGTVLLLSSGCNKSNNKESSSISNETNSNTVEVCETCGNPIEGLGYFDDIDTGWRPATSNDFIIKSICSKSCGMRYNRRNGDKPDNWSTKH